MLESKNDNASYNLDIDLEAREITETNPLNPISTYGYRNGRRYRKTNCITFNLLLFLECEE